MNQQSNLAQNNYENLQVVKEVMIDMGEEIDSITQNIERLKLSEQRAEQNIRQMDEKIDFIRAKTETKLFAALPDAA